MKLWLTAAVALLAGAALGWFLGWLMLDALEEMGRWIDSITW